ncbi:hypothetical protein OH77DRAFT_493295 [Trametes cingulata]|nr:hypothetical protein OH77DRAFT_493295 [Trametes cingulata]
MLRLGSTARASTASTPGWQCRMRGTSRTRGRHSAPGSESPAHPLRPASCRRRARRGRVRTRAHTDTMSAERAHRVSVVRLPCLAPRVSRLASRISRPAFHRPHARYAVACPHCREHPASPRPRVPAASSRALPHSIRGKLARHWHIRYSTTQYACVGRPEHRPDSETNIAADMAVLIQTCMRPRNARSRESYRTGSESTGGSRDGLGRRRRLGVSCVGPRCSLLAARTVTRARPRTRTMPAVELRP